jgi:PAS domain S-box-containing protein
MFYNLYGLRGILSYFNLKRGSGLQNILTAMDNGELEDLIKQLQLENEALKIKLDDKTKRVLQLEQLILNKENAGLNQKHVEKTHQEELLLLRTLINHLPSSIFVIDNQYRKTAFNEAHLKRVESTLYLQGNLTEADLLGKTNWDVYPKELADQYYEEDRKVIENGETVLEREIFQIDKFGNQVWETISKIPMRDEDGLITGMLGIAHNITKNKLAEIALQESEERYRFLFENNPAPMLIYDRKSLILLAVNEAFITHYGYTKEETLKKSLPDLYPLNEKESIVKVAASLEGYKNVGEWHHGKANGELITIVASSNDIIFKNRKARVAVITDITDRKMMENKLKASEEKFRLISNSAHDGIFMLNQNNRFIYWNPAVERIFEYPGEELAFADINELLHSQNEKAQKYLPVNVSNISEIFGDSGSSFEVEISRRSGDVIQIELSLAPINIYNLWGAVGIVRNITERKIFEKELIRAKEMAVESDR